MISVSTDCFETLDTDVGLLRPALTLERERPRHDADRQRAELPGDVGHDGGPARAGATALAGGYEHHVGALEDLLDLPGAHRRPAAGLGVRPRTQASGRLPADVELDVRLGHQEGLGVRVDGHELHALQACLDHAVDGVHAAAADADDLDDRQVVLGACIMSSASVSPGHFGIRGAHTCRECPLPQPLVEVYCYVNLPYKASTLHNGPRGVNPRRRA